MRRVWGGAHEIKTLGMLPLLYSAYISADYEHVPYHSSSFLCILHSVHLNLTLLNSQIKEKQLCRQRESKPWKVSSSSSYRIMQKPVTHTCTHMHTQSSLFLLSSGERVCLLSAAGFSFSLLSLTLSLSLLLCSCCVCYALCLKQRHTRALMSRLRATQRRSPIS